ncbi:hypothetical protein RhiirC2_709825 [Rhizophagus irregularis]|uniref:Uncharacterized protein n=1 Tax=Rhizophagus irregularis TaxID=588596 RepID=A0A2N1NGW1_9GLOM|nr:hypothetical protein RhiirC2_709825 [Rhizophagus irregularis]
MVFEHLFYPDNQRKSQEVIEYQVKFRRSFMDFKSSWNIFCGRFNVVVKETKPDWVLRLLEYNSLQSAEYILGEINKVLEDARIIISGSYIVNLWTIFKFLKPVSVAVRAAIKVTKGFIAYAIVGVAFVAITDLVIGEIQSRELKNVIEVMKKFDEGRIVHLDTARMRIDGINQNIKDGTYIVDGEHIILRGKLMSYHPS